MDTEPLTTPAPAALAPAPDPQRIDHFEQIVLSLQGGGALGAYQAGVYAALAEANVVPDWVIGTSIGAINGALIAGNPVGERVARLRDFWTRVSDEYPLEFARQLPFVGAETANLFTMVQGNPAFFVPNPAAVDTHARLGPAKAGFYSVAPLRRTLDECIALDTIGSHPTRLTVGAAKITTSEMIYFDSARMDLTLDHILASGALPPAFPPVAIQDEWFWDGGLLSNTPIETVFEENPRRRSLVFEVQLWNPDGPPPATMFDVMTRAKDVQYASRSAVAVEREKKTHRLRHIIRELADRLPVEDREDERVRMLLGYGCEATMHIVRLQAPALAHEDYAKDIDFSVEGIAARWAAGLADTRAVLAAAPWRQEMDRMEGVIVHEARGGAVVGSR